MAKPSSPAPAAALEGAMRAARLGHCSKLRSMLRAQPSLALLADPRGGTLLISCASGPAERASACARAVLDAGADIHAESLGGETALVRAAAEGPLDLTLLLLRAGAEPSHRSLRGPSAAMWAAKRHDGGPILAALAKAGADFSAVDLAGADAAAWARCHGRDANESFCRERAQIQLEARSIAESTLSGKEARAKPRL